MMLLSGIESEVRRTAAAFARGVDAFALVTAASDPAASRVVLANDAMCDLLGFKASDLLGQRVAAIAPTRGELALAAPACALASDNRPVARRTIRRQDGDEIAVDLQVVPVRDQAGRATHHAVFARRVSAGSDEPSSFDAAPILEQSVDAAAQLAGGAAGELRAPLARVIAHLELLLATLDARDRELLRVAEEALASAHRANDIADSLRLLAGADAPKRPLDVHEALDRALEIAGPSLLRRASVERKYAPAPLVDASFARLTQAFVHLLTNAAESFPGEAPAQNRVTICTHVARTGGVRVEISDTGQGIDPGDLPHVFEPFFTTRPRATSAGLGLSVVRAVVRALRGTVRISSAVGRGTTVRLALPPSKSGATRAPGARPSVRASKWILVVGEDAHAYEAIARTLDGPSAALSYAAPDDALDRIALGEPYDLVVVQRDLASRAGAPVREEIERAAPHLLVVEMAPPRRAERASVPRERVAV